MCMYVCCVCSRAYEYEHEYEYVHVCCVCANHSHTYKHPPLSLSGVQKHEKSCKKATRGSRKRGVFNARAQRLGLSKYELEYQVSSFQLWMCLCTCMWWECVYVSVCVWCMYMGLVQKIQTHTYIWTHKYKNIHTYMCMCIYPHIHSHTEQTQKSNGWEESRRNKL